MVSEGTHPWDDRVPNPAPWGLGASGRRPLWGGVPSLTQSTQHNDSHFPSFRHWPPACAACVKSQQPPASRPPSPARAGQCERAGAQQAWTLPVRHGHVPRLQPAQVRHPRLWLLSGAGFPQRPPPCCWPGAHSAETGGRGQWQPGPQGGGARRERPVGEAHGRDHLLWGGLRGQVGHLLWRRDCKQGQGEQV